MAKKKKIVRSDKPLSLSQLERIVYDLFEGLIYGAECDGGESTNFLAAAKNGAATSMFNFRANHTTTRKRKAVRK